MKKNPLFVPRRGTAAGRSGKRYVIASTLEGGHATVKVYFALIPIPHWSGPAEPVIAKTFPTRQEAEAAIGRYKLLDRASCWIETIDYDRKEKVTP